MNYKTVASQILTAIGGEENVIAMNHCATRLRFTLKDKNKINETELNSIQDVIHTLWAGDELHIVIGPSVAQVYKAILKISNIKEGQSLDINVDENTERPKESLMNRFVGLISATFTPLIPAFVGSGMVFALAAVLTRFNIITDTSGTYQVLAAIGTAAFYFLPIYTSITLAKKLGCNPFVAGAIGAALVTPTFTGMVDAGEAVSFLGIPISLFSYGSTIVPTFFSTIAYSYLEKFLDKVLPSSLQLVFSSVISMLIIVPLTILVFGPLGTWIGNIMFAVINGVNTISPVLLGIVIGGCNFILIILGLGWILVPLQLTNLAHGGDPILAMLGAMNFAIFGIAFGIWIKAKKPELKAIASSATLTGLLGGISEPTLYGLVLRYRKTIPFLMLGGAVGGAIIGAFGSKALGYCFQNIFTFANYEPMFGYILGCVVAFAITTALVVIFGFESKSKPEEVK